MGEFKIMLVEDDPAIRSLMAEALASWDYRILAPDPGADLVALVASESPHLLILDVGLPRLDGYEWCERVRSVSRLPILFVSARSDPRDAVRGLACGGDDWLSKPFETELLLAKVRAMLRRAYSWAPESPALLARGDLVLDKERCEASSGGAKARLTKHESLLLARLIERDGRVATRDELMDALWSGEAFVDENTLNVNVARLRSALADLGLPDAVQTVRGLGYKLT
jgi:Response regulators consisting of a CheY-like receiver domain and a winged-helix DNA-binding domain